jgi:hypothetical protein
MVRIGSGKVNDAFLAGVDQGELEHAEGDGYVLVRRVYLETCRALRWSISSPRLFPSWAIDT